LLLLFIVVGAAFAFSPIDFLSFCELKREKCRKGKIDNRRSCNIRLSSFLLRCCLVVTKKKPSKHMCEAKQLRRNCRKNKKKNKLDSFSVSFTICGKLFYLCFHLQIPLFDTAKQASRKAIAKTVYVRSLLLLQTECKQKLKTFVVAER